MDHAHEKVLQMLTLAARLRGHAAETSLEQFREKFQASAAELEQAAVKAERQFKHQANRTPAPRPAPGPENGPGYRH